MLNLILSSLFFALLSQWFMSQSKHHHYDNLNFSEFFLKVNLLSPQCYLKCTNTFVQRGKVCVTRSKEVLPHRRYVPRRRTIITEELIICIAFTTKNKRMLNFFLKFNIPWLICMENVTFLNVIPSENHKSTHNRKKTVKRSEMTVPNAE